MVDPTLPLPSMSPVAGNEIVARFGGGRLSSDGVLLVLREIERRLEVADRLAACIAFAPPDAIRSHWPRPRIRLDPDQHPRDPRRRPGGEHTPPASRPIRAPARCLAHGVLRPPAPGGGSAGSWPASRPAARAPIPVSSSPTSPTAAADPSTRTSTAARAGRKPTHLAADRTSCTKATANQFRLFLHAGTCWLL
jgi:hypothetical protein